MMTYAPAITPCFSVPLIGCVVNGPVNRTILVPCRPEYTAASVRIGSRRAGCFQRHAVGS